MSTEKTPEGEISLEHWVVLELLRVEEFVAFWRNGATGCDADAFPAAMPAGEWDEQYRSWGGG